MVRYHLLTIWRINAPLADVFAVVEDTLRWPDWWPSVRQVDELERGDAQGIGNVRHYAWQGKLPYRVEFDIRATRVDPLVAIEGQANGDLEGIGRWRFHRQGDATVVRYDWRVDSKRWWMNLVAPVARAMFVRNHAQIMAQGGRALARRLNAPVPQQEHIDLSASTRAHPAAVAHPARRAPANGVPARGLAARGGNARRVRS